MCNANRPGGPKSGDPMHIVAETDKGYALACDCPKEFSSAHMRLTFECPHCGAAAYAAELVCNWVWENAQQHRR